MDERLRFEPGTPYHLLDLGMQFLTNPPSSSNTREPIIADSKMEHRFLVALNTLQRQYKTEQIYDTQGHLQDGRLVVSEDIFSSKQWSLRSTPVAQHYYREMLALAHEFGVSPKRTQSNEWSLRVKRARGYDQILVLAKAEDALVGRAYTICTVCALCEGRPAGTKLKVCGACRQIHYCSDACQRKAWPSHKLTCQKIQQT